VGVSGALTIEPAAPPEFDRAKVVVAVSIGHTIDTFFAVTAGGVLAHLASWSCDLLGRVTLGWTSRPASVRAWAFWGLLHCVGTTLLAL
jgi:hypothetical protein